MAPTKTRNRQKMSTYVSKQGGQEQERRGGPSVLKGAFSGKKPGSMNSKYLIGLSMAMNVILLSSLVYKKNYRAGVLRDEGKSLVNHIHLAPPESNRMCGVAVKTRYVADAAQSVLASDSKSCGHGFLVTKTNNPSISPSFAVESENGLVCKCHACFTGHNCSSLVSNCVINLGHGDPTMFESFWMKNGQKSTTVILGWQLMSYFADAENVCWFLQPELAKEIRSLHSLVGNAVTKGRHIIVGTGSTQLFQAALYALSTREQLSRPIDVVSAAPYYSSYPLETDYLKSNLYRWAGDAYKYKAASDEADNYIELVTSPNNPDGFTREAVVNGSGAVVYDHAYYWPQYTPITSPADGDIMLFTVSKTTGHAGTRIGWAVVKDAEVAKKMTKYIELNTIGVSKDSQLRASQILRSVSNSHVAEDKDEQEEEQELRFFHHGYSLMAERWKRLRDVVSLGNRFSLPDFEPAFCNFFGRHTTPQPAFVWLKCQGKGNGIDGEVEDCEKLLSRHGIMTRGGRHFGAPQNYVRLSILDRNPIFNLLIHRLSTIH